MSNENPEKHVFIYTRASPRNGGEVPLHGLLFAQWLHYAFPNECPHPRVLEISAAAMVKQGSRSNNLRSGKQVEMLVDAFSFLETGLLANKRARLGQAGPVGPGCPVGPVD